MVKPIIEYTKEELEEKIVKIKAERERTAEALKKYEEELERRKQEVPCGVPCKLKSKMYYFLNSKNEVVCPTTLDNKWDALDRQSACNVFESYESAEKHSEMLLDWRKDGLMANANGNPIDIKVLLPLLEKGKVAFCPISRSWFWANETPQLMDDTWGIHGNFSWIGGFNIKTADDWKTSLMECGL